MRILRILCFPLALSACTAIGQPPAAPSGLTATGYERHVELDWPKNAEPSVSEYRVYRSTDGVDFSLFKTVSANLPICIDWTGDEGLNLSRSYKIAAVANGQVSDFSAPVTATTATMDDEQLLDMTQRSAFRYFWDYGHPTSGLARERSNGNDDIVTTGGSGFGIMALIVATERGWITRDQAVERMVQIVSFLQFADRFHGAYPHWMDGNTGNVIPFSQYDNGADLVETAFLMQGLLAARQYFDQDTPLESAVRSVITGLWEDVDWNWFRKNNGPVLYWHWSPNYAWQMNFPLRGFFEAQIVYILAAASPTHPVPASLYQTGWTSGNYANPASYYGYKVYCGPYGGGPMFFAHYSYLGFDPRGRKDAFCNYFVRNRNHALMQVAYATANPENHDGYSAECWGLTSSDDPNGYSAHDIWPQNDNGTVSPTGALASMPYVPAESMNALRHFYRDLGEGLWGPFGFYDAFNEDQNWIADSYLAIDEGPIVAMIENQRTGLLWSLFMSNPEIEPALSAIGFVADASDVKGQELREKGFSVAFSPNPATTQHPIEVQLTLSSPQQLTGTLFSANGREALKAFSGKNFPQGESREAIQGIAPGVWLLKIENEKGEFLYKKILIIND